MRTLVIPLVFALALIQPVAAQHCVTWSTYEDPVLDTGVAGVPAPRHYVTHDTPQLPCCVFGVWYVYEESNGIDGLQRDDEMFDDTCHGVIRSDTILF